MNDITTLFLDQQDGVVEQAGDHGPRDEHKEGAAGEQQALRPGRRDARHGRKGAKSFC